MSKPKVLEKMDSIPQSAADIGAVSVENQFVIIDDTTGTEVKIGIDNGALYYEEVTE